MIKQFYKATLAVILTAMIWSISLIAAPLSHAGELEYLQMLNYRGLMIYDTSLALLTGYQTCEALNYTTGDKVIPQIMMSKVDVNQTQAYIILVTAVEELCPWHDHRGEVLG